MSKKNQISIKNPCYRTWESLDGKGCERFCASCSSTVVDLTNKSSSEIISLVLRQKGRVCGRIRQDQVDRILLQNNANTSLTKTFLVFVLGFATITTTQAASNKPVSLTYPNDTLKSTLIAGKEENITYSKIDTTYKISGHVIDSSSKTALPGVSVVIKGTSIGTETNREGHFTLIVPKDEVTKQSITLNFIYIGYTRTEIELPRKDMCNIEVGLSVEAMWIGEIYIPWYKRFWWTLTSPFRKNKSY